MLQWRKRQINYAKERFKNFRAEFKDYGELQTLDWMDKDGRSDYHVHYIFDTDQQYMHVSGDLGSACFCLTWKPKFENVYNLIRDPGYIIRKLECSTDDFVYPEEYVRNEIEDCYKDLSPVPDKYENYEKYLEAKKDFDEILESFINAFDGTRGFVQSDCDRFDEMEDLDPEWYEHSFGECIAPRVYYWLMGLRMAWDQLHEDGAENDK